jgi:anion-transporting  ArsA/GET3 family ATPase
MQMFMKPTGFATRVVGRGSSMALGVLKKIIGIDLISDLAEFFEAFSSMVGGFRERAKRVTELLGAKETTFVIVCGPQGDPIDEAVYFHRKLVEAKMPVGGVIVNKVQYHSGGAGDLAEGSLPKEVTRAVKDDDLAGRVVANFEDFKALAERDAANIEHLARELKQKRVIRVPYLDEDVHDLAGLLEINRYLFAESAEQREKIEAGVA